MSNWHILIVEDDPDGQDVVSRVLHYQRIGTDSVATAEDALAQLATTEYSATIIDLALPGMDGWTLLEAIQSNPNTAHLPCVAITAYHSPELAVKARAAGFAAYLPKPLETGALVRTLERILQ